MNNTPKPPPRVEALIEETRAAFQSLYPDPLTDDDCREIITNVFGFFDVLYAQDFESVNVTEPISRSE